MNYIKEATRTESVDLFKVDSSRLLHAAIGAVTEVVELLGADDTTNVKEEMGDILWYVAIACSELELTIEELIAVGVTTEGGLETLLFEAGDALDVIKRGLFYGIDLDKARFIKHFSTMALALLGLAEACGWSLADLQETNIAKLSARYPEKFTSSKAVTRNTEAEREAVGT